MDPRNQTRTFKKIPVVAAIMSLTNRVPNSLFDGSSRLVEFEFKDDETIQQIVLALSSGNLMVNASEYEKARSYLYRKVNEIAGGRHVN